VKAKPAATIEQSAPLELHYDDVDSSRTLNRRPPFIVENAAYIFGLLAVAVVVLGFSSTFFDIFRGPIVETESDTEEADVHTSLGAQGALEDFEPPRNRTSKVGTATVQTEQPASEARTTIQLALQKYVERHQEIEANAAKIDDLTNELFCAMDVECGNVLCTDLIDATMRDASAAKAEAESVFQSQANASQARRAVAARATQERCLRAIKFALKRRVETCGPD
jgi:hypothetical protein